MTYSREARRARELARSASPRSTKGSSELREARAALAGLPADCDSKRGGSCSILTAFDPK